MKLSKQLKIDLVGYSFILLNLAGTLIFTLLPLLFSFFISFTDWDFSSGFGTWQFNWGKNYLDMWSDEWFVASFKNTVIYAFSVVPLTIALAMVLAVIIDKYCFCKLPLRLTMFMPHVSNVVAVAVVWVMMYSPYGPITQFIKSLGWENPPR